MMEDKRKNAKIERNSHQPIEDPEKINPPDTGSSVKKEDDDNS